jgi:hypothetical protein
VGVGVGVDEKECRGGGTESGNLEAMRFLRGLDPPAPWDASLVQADGCSRQPGDANPPALADPPPCPWDALVLSSAARREEVQ